ncbi:orotate phosphoribosyltransferase [Fodinibius halophilus]|uniref:Orotate phosphoribosyltransferase n=1 Tax=Fodinibius halophilus TaxID=1736908 RepID=A0A6M1T3E4_9BACT|nr:orotate phosphoribosyltransferase [Fodinibius halophilus]NGP89956.1 orotate phosphoribosyltransferase [Fodinibius halophilus]
MIIDQQFAEEIALDLLNINAVILRPNDPFTWSSGWNSPIYCDNRLTMRYPKIRKKIAQKLVAFISEEYPDIDVITGTATAGIPHAAWVSENMDKPMSYVRAKAKAYGLGNQIEGGIQKGESTVVIEDLISTGGSAMSVVEALRFVGVNIEAVLSIFTYGFDKAIQRFEETDVTVYSLTDYPTLIQVASENDYVDASDLKTLGEWRQNPETWPN